MKLYPVRHDFGVAACKHIAFFLRRRICVGEVLSGGDVETVDGRILHVGENVNCGECNAPVGGMVLGPDSEYQIVESLRMFREVITE